MLFVVVVVVCLFVCLAGLFVVVWCWLVGLVVVWLGWCLLFLFACLFSCVFACLVCFVFNVVVVVFCLFFVCLCCFCWMLLRCRRRRPRCCCFVCLCVCFFGYIFVCAFLVLFSV